MAHLILCHPYFYGPKITSSKVEYMNIVFHDITMFHWLPLTYFEASHVAFFHRDFIVPKKSCFIGG